VSGDDADAADMYDGTASAARRSH